MIDANSYLEAIQIILIVGISFLISFIFVVLDSKSYKSNQDDLNYRKPSVCSKGEEIIKSKEDKKQNDRNTKLVG